MGPYKPRAELFKTTACKFVKPQEHAYHSLAGLFASPYGSLVMPSLLISPSSPAELKLLTALLKKMNIATKVLSDEEKEDLGLGMLMRQAAEAPKVSRAVVMRKLGGA